MPNDGATIALSFYDHHRQSYGAMPITRADGATAEFMVGDNGEPDREGCGEGGEFAIHLVNLQAGVHRWHQTYMSPLLRVHHDAIGSLRAFLDSGAWGAVCEAAERQAIRTRDDLTSLLLDAGLRDRSDNPVGWVAVCSCCGRSNAEET